MDELIESFSIERVGKSGSRFDPEKAKWFNRQHLIRKSDEDLAEAFAVIIKEKGFNVPQEKIVKLTSLVRERAEFVKDLWDQADFFFIAPSEYDKEVVSKRWKEESPSQISELILLLEQVGNFASHDTEATVKEWITIKGYNTGSVLNIFRLLVVGASRGPHLFDITEWIGREETLTRLQNGLAKLTKP
jgi:glutamyl/glutaminyl-tRNA synthetase